MKKILGIALTAIMALSIGSVIAQPNRTNQKFNRSDDRGTYRHVYACWEGLDMTEKQRAELIDLYAEIAKERPLPLRAQTERGERPTEEQFKQRAAEVDKLNKKFEAGVKKILTKEQYAKWEENRENHRKLMMEKGDYRRNNRDNNFSRGRNGGRKDSRQMRCPNCQFMGNAWKFEEAKSDNQTLESK